MSSYDMTQYDYQHTNDAVGVTRVMSPNESQYAGMDVVPYYQEARSANHTVLIGLSGLCQQCGVIATEPSMCAGCGVYGHPVCLNLEHFQLYFLEMLRQIFHNRLLVVVLENSHAI